MVNIGYPSQWTKHARAGAAVAIIIAVLGFLPLITLSMAPLADWPSHLARVWITNRVLNGDSFWILRYKYTGLLIPNAVLDAVILGLIKAGASIEIAGKCFLLICYSSFVLGFWRLAQSRSLPSAFSMATAVSLFYTGNIIFGLLNFTTGIGICFFALSLWIKDSTSITKRMLIIVLALPLIMFCHVVSALVFAVSCFFYDFFYLQRGMKKRLTVIIPSSFALALVFLGYQLSKTGNNPLSINYDGAPRLRGLIIGKVRQAAEGLSSGSQIGDVFTIALLIISAYAMFLQRRSIERSTLLLASAVLVIPLIAPFGVGEGNLLDTRLFSIALIMCLMILLRSCMVNCYLSFLSVICASGKVIALTILWKSYEPLYSNILSQMSNLPAGSTLWAAYSDEPDFYLDRQPPLRNAASLAVVYGVFVPSTFAEPTQQPLVIIDRWRPEWMWSHSANARSPENRAVILSKLSEMCKTNPNTYLYILHPTLQSRVTIEKSCLTSSLSR